ncbi:hypothetical protein Tco_1182122 [Tanacetum coccineum]
MSEVKKTDHSADVLASIKSQVPTVVNEYLGTKLDDSLLKILERHTADLIEKNPVLLAQIHQLLKQLQIGKGNLSKIYKFAIPILCQRKGLLIRPKKHKVIQTLTPAEQEAADIMKALTESKKMSKRQPVNLDAPK